MRADGVSRRPRISPERPSPVRATEAEPTSSPRRGWRASTITPARAAAFLLSMALVATAPAPGSAQEEARPAEAIPEAYAALEACSRAAEEERREAAEAAAERAEALFRSLEEEPGREAEALTGRARALVQCRIPLANFMRQGALLERSNELLERALRLAPDSWRARFALALNHYHSPDFLGRTDAGMAQLEILVARGGDRTGVPVLPDAYLYLGDLYLRAGRQAAAAEAWRKGASLFPDRRDRYETRLEEAGFDPEPDPEDEPERDPRDAPDEAGNASEEAAAHSPAEDGPLYALEAIAVEVGGFSMEDPRTATELSKLDVYTAPGGAADLLQVFQTMPGVTRVTDGSDLYVRGGDPEETPMFVDGARLFYPGRFETLNGSITVGSPSAASTGQPLVFPLPGGGHGQVVTRAALLPDGTPLVETGVVPDIRVEATIADVRRGRDPVLARAVEELERRTARGSRFPEP